MSLGLWEFFWGAWPPNPPSTLQGGGSYALPYVSRRLRMFNRPRRFLPALPVVAIAEANAHFLARFYPTKLTVSTLYRQQSLFEAPVVETNTHTIGRFVSTKIFRFAYNSWDQSQPPVVEINVHTIGKFTPAKLTRFAFNSWDQGQPPVTETNTHWLGFFKNPPRWSFKFNSWDQSQPAVAETQPHYLARFKPAKLLVWPGLRQHADIQPPAVATNPHFLATFKPTRLTVSPLLYRQRTGHDVPAGAPAQVVGGGFGALPFVSRKLRIFGRPRHPFVLPPAVTTTTFSGGGFGLLLRFPRSSWIVNTARYGIVPVQPETNPHFLARFKPTKLTVWPFLNSQDRSGQSAPLPVKGGGFYAQSYTSRRPRIFGRPKHGFIVPPVVAPSFATNPHFLGRFKPAKITVSAFLRQHADYQPPVFETNTHSIGRFTPIKLTVSPLLYRQAASLDITVASETQPHFLAKFKSAPAWRFNYNSWDQSQPPVAETQPHFLARFTPVKLVIWSGYRRHEDFGPSVAETNVHTLGRFTAAKLFVSPLLREHHPGDLNAIIVPPPVLRRGKQRYVARKPRIFGRPKHLLGSFPPPPVAVVETNPHYLATFKPTKLISFAYNSTDTGVAQQETQPHFIGRFRQVSIWRFNFNTWDTGVPQTETNPHFVARFNPARLSWFRYNSTDTGVPQVETNPHYIARYVPARLSRFAYNSTDTAVAQVETNPHQIGRFTPAKPIQFRYNTRADDPPVTETNPHFLATYKPARVSRFGYNNRADDPPVVETNPHQIGSYRATKITKLAALWNNPAADIFVQGPQGREGEPHFIARFVPTKYISFRFNTPDTLVPLVPEAWAIGPERHLVATDPGRSLVATDPGRHLTATDPGRNLTAIDPGRNLIATRR